jgi:hypothetical protein
MRRLAEKVKKIPAMRFAIAGVPVRCDARICSA